MGAGADLGTGESSSQTAPAQGHSGPCCSTLQLDSRSEMGQNWQSGAQLVGCRGQQGKVWENVAEPEAEPVEQQVGMQESQTPDL